MLATGLEGVPASICYGQWRWQEWSQQQWQPVGFISGALLRQKDILMTEKLAVFREEPNGEEGTIGTI